RGSLPSPSRSGGFQDAVLGQLVVADPLEDWGAHLLGALGDLGVLDLADDLRFDEDGALDAGELGVVDRWGAPGERPEGLEQPLEHLVGEAAPGLPDPAQVPVGVCPDQYSAERGAAIALAGCEP